LAKIICFQITLKHVLIFNDIINILKMPKGIFHKLTYTYALLKILTYNLTGIYINDCLMISMISMFSMISMISMIS